MNRVPASARLPESATIPQAPHDSTQSHRHPRQTSPQDMTHLSGYKRRKLSQSPVKVEVAKGTTTLPPTVADAILKTQDSSSDESASRWFDKSNEFVPQNIRASANYDDEPPFFVSNQNQYPSNIFAASETSRVFGGQSRMDSENEDLRGVIDDLTVENKRLKHILRASSKSQRNSPSTDGQDKLFEVRMHGLPSEKRRELEFLLKNFATSIHTSAPSISNSTAGSGVSSMNGLAANHHKTTKTDSGYASNSTSGQPVGLNRETSALPSISRHSKNKNIKNYLHDIPDTLMPRQHPMVMSERARMALVVRRLEQLFTGRQAAPGVHSQPLQQQEVSDLAARADAQSNKHRLTEGKREAHILPPESRINLDALDPAATGEKRKRPAMNTSGSDMSASDGHGVMNSRAGSPDQRPTRPLDLDIHRAQVAAENINYIRHLGLSSPHLYAKDESDDAWMYLNLLTNMAQLHTINVTPEFVRKSIKRLSTKFQLSKDGYKVRWVGGPDGTVFSKEEEKALENVDNDKEHQSPEESNEDISSSSKRSKTDSSSNALVSNTTTSEDKTSGLQTSTASKPQISTAPTSNQPFATPSQPTQSGSAFDYKPIIFRERSKEVAEESYLQDSNSSSGDTSRDSSGLAHALSKSNLNQQRSSDEGLITFYNNPYFCSDYSGENTPSNMATDRDAESGLIVGIKPEIESTESVSRLADACYFTPQFNHVRYHESDNETLPAVDFADILESGEEETQPLEFACSGLGGVTPDDNFAMDVRVHLSEAQSSDMSRPIAYVPCTKTAIKPRFVYSQGSCQTLELLPSRLPPPSYVFFTSSSSSGVQATEDSDSESEDSSSSEEEENNNVPPKFLQHWSRATSGDVDDCDSESDGDVQDDSSVDMLAVARAADPMRIAEQERQYMINQPAGRAVAGSLAATVGASHSTSSVQDIDSDRAEIDSERGDDEDDDDEESEMDVDNE